MTRKPNVVCMSSFRKPTMEEFSKQLLLLLFCLTTFIIEKVSLENIEDEPIVKHLTYYYENVTDKELNLQMRDSIICNQMMENGKGTFYKFVISPDCANPPSYNYEEDGFTDHCREVAYQCLKKDWNMLETFAEVASNLSRISKKSAKKAYAVPFNIIERNAGMRKVLMKCVHEFNVDQQWFLARSSNNCIYSSNTSE